MPRKMFGTKTWEVGGNYITRNFTICTTIKHQLDDQLKKDGMGRACGICGEKRNACRVLIGNHEGKKPLSNLGTERRIIF